MKVLSAAQIRAWDAYTVQHEPVSSLALMERAAGCCADWILQSGYRNHSFQIYCGPGNNGGDGLVIARLLQAAGCQVCVWLTDSTQRSRDCQASLEKARQAGVPIMQAQDKPLVTSCPTLIIDALFGTGLRKSPEEQPAALIRHINQAGLPVVSIDLPSGLPADDLAPGEVVVKATHTLTFGCYKAAFLWKENQVFTGRIVLLDIGLHPGFLSGVSSTLFTTGLQEAKQLFRPRPSHYHKYQFGHALLLAGSDRMMGAALLAAGACLRSGAGLVTVHTPLHRMPVLQAAVPEAIASDEKDTSALLHKKSAIGIGPGWEIHEENGRLLEDVLRLYEGPLVLDASALTLLSSRLHRLHARKSGTTILTPHAGEFDRLFGGSSDDRVRMQRVNEMARQYGCCIILKGKFTLVALPGGELFFNTSGNSGMATAGSGDVLTGILTGLCAQGYSTADACRLGVYLHGLAGDLAATAGAEESLTAGDISRYLGAAYRQLQSVNESGSQAFF